MEYVADICILMSLGNRATRNVNRPPVGLMSVARTPKVVGIFRSSKYCTAAVVIIDDGMHMQTGTITFDSTTQQALQMQRNPLEWLTVILPYRSPFSMIVRLTPKYQASRVKAVVRRGLDR